MSIIKREIILPDDDEFYGQALNRKVVPANKGKMCIESKQAMKDPNREGGAVSESPDVADAVFGAIAPMPMAQAYQVMGSPDAVAETKESVWSSREQRPSWDEQPIPGAWFG